MRVIAPLIVVLLSTGLTGCWFGKKKTPKVPLSIPLPQTPPPQTPIPETSVPQPPPPAPTSPPPAMPTPSQKTQAPSSKPTRRRPIEKPSPAPAPRQAEPEPEPVTPSAPPAAQAPVPRLGEILSDEMRTQYEAEFGQRIVRARSALNGISGRSLSNGQTETVERIRSFIRQAEDTKPRDLPTALQLARRADLLGQDLLASFK